MRSLGTVFWRGAFRHRDSGTSYVCIVFRVVMFVVCVRNLVLHINLLYLRREVVADTPASYLGGLRFELARGRVGRCIRCQDSHC
jgi:hypothetical protein